MEVSVRLCLCISLLVLGCRKDEAGATQQETDVAPPASCVAGDEVCASFSADWTQDEADAACLELDGVEGECAEGELGRCVFEDGLEYRLYEMPPLDAAAYCDYLGGEWLKPGEELGEE